MGGGRRQWLILGWLVLLAAAAVWQALRRDQDGAAPQAEVPVIATPVPPTQPVERGGVMMMAIANQAARLNSTQTDAREDVMILDQLLGQYRRAYTMNPVGLNHEIVRALAGGNARRAAFIDPAHPAVNDRGELVDRWGTPFFFHQLSGTRMEVISAGPDKQLWTADDVKSEPG